MPRRSALISVCLLAATLLLPPSLVAAAAPSITSFSPTSGPVGTIVTIQGANLTGATALTVNGVGAAIKTTAATVITAVVPATSSGKIKVTTSAGSATSVATFAVTRGIALSVATTPPGTNIGVSGTAFSHSKAVQLFLDGDSLAMTTTSAVGAFSNVSIHIPETTAPGKHWISALDRATSTLTQKQLTVFTNWSQFHGGPLHQGRNSAEHTLSPANVGNMEQVWATTATGGAISSSPAVVNGMVYVGSDDHKLYAYRADCSDPCHPAWVSTPTGGALSSSPAVANGVVYVGSDDGRLYAFPAACTTPCARLWRSQPMGSTMRSSPTVVDGVVYIAPLVDAKLHAFPAKCSDPCAERWVSTGALVQSQAPTVFNGLVYVGSMTGNVYAFSTNCHGTCSATWSTPSTPSVTGTVDSAVAIASGTMFFTADDPSVHAFPADCTSCTELWASSGSGADLTTPAVAEGIVVIGSANTKVYAFPTACANPCAPMWVATTGAQTIVPSSSAAIANGVVYIGSVDGRLYAFPVTCSNPCRALWASASNSQIVSSPAVANGVVYVGSSDKKLHAYSASPITVDSAPRPTLHQLLANSR